MVSWVFGEMKVRALTRVISMLLLSLYDPPTNESMCQGFRATT